MGQFVGILVNALADGSVYALIAVGFSVILRSTRVAQFGAGYVAIAFGVMFATAASSFGPWGALCVTLSAGVVLGVALYLVVVRVGERFRASDVSVSIAVLAVGVLLGSLVDGWTKGLPQSAPTFVHGYFEIGSTVVQWNEVAVIPVAAIGLVLLYLVVSKTLLGKAMLAVSTSADVARASGVRMATVVAASWIIATVAMALAGGLFTSMVAVDSTLSLPLALKGFAGSIIGGVGRPANAALGALMLAVADTLFVRYVGATYETIFVFFLIFAILILRPQGVFSRQPARIA